MQTWWNTSPFYDVNIYMSGRNRGCTQAQLTAAWVNSVTAQGWGLIPTIVGYQSPCSVCTSCVKHSSDAPTAEQQGRGEADIAIADANALGLTQGTVLYYDMERYDDLSGTGACSTPTKAFLKGWTDRLKELGYKSGVYGSPFNANGDWINIPQASQPDIVWLARWNNVMSVWGVAPLPDTYWTNHQRIHQWLGPRNETWGGVTFNIDNNISDAPVAGLAIAKNKRADFDGDGRSDISVWRRLVRLEQLEFELRDSEFRNFNRCSRAGRLRRRRQDGFCCLATVGRNMASLFARGLSLIRIRHKRRHSRSGGLRRRRADGRGGFSPLDRRLVYLEQL
jgi:Domain of unknown function (DUF1906)